MFVVSFLGLLFALGDLFPESTKVLAIQSLIAEICERWYVQDRDGKESVVAHTLLFLLIKTNQPNAQLADLKRLYAMMIRRMRIS